MSCSACQVVDKSYPGARFQPPEINGISSNFYQCPRCKQRYWLANAENAAWVALSKEKWDELQAAESRCCAGPMVAKC